MESRKRRMNMKKLTLVELNEETRKELFAGNLEEVVAYLKENPDLYEWQLENDADAEMPDLDSVEVLRDLENELKKIDLSWWALVIEQ
jgi:CheY-like chemotaxis protein